MRTDANLISPEPKVADKLPKRRQGKWIRRLIWFGVLLYIFSEVSLSIYDYVTKQYKFYCVDKYATYTKLIKSKSIPELQNYYWENGEKNKYGFFVERFGNYYKAPRRYTIGNIDITNRIEYIKKPCQKGKTKDGKLLTITCNIGYYRGQLLQSYITDLKNGFYKTVLNVIPVSKESKARERRRRALGYKKNRDVDICYKKLELFNSVRAKKTYYKDGKVKTYIEYFPNYGKIKKQKKTYWESNGKLKTLILYQANGRAKRKAVVYWENGNKSKETSYNWKGVKRDGEYTYYENGKKKTNTAYYSNGKIESRFCYDVDGYARDCTIEKHGCTTKRPLSCINK